MHAVIETGGKQYRVEPGSRIRVERLAAAQGERVEFDRVLLAGDGEDAVTGGPCIPGAKVSATVLGHGRARKITIVKFKRRKGYMRKQGHRQGYNELRVTEVSAG